VLAGGRAAAGWHAWRCAGRTCVVNGLSLPAALRARATRCYDRRVAGMELGGWGESTPAGQVNGLVPPAPFCWHVGSIWIVRSCSMIHL